MTRMMMTLNSTQKASVLLLPVAGLTLFWRAFFPFPLSFFSWQGILPLKSLLALDSIIYTRFFVKTPNSRLYYYIATDHII